MLVLDKWLVLKIPLWYAINGEKPEFEYSFGYQNWYKSAEYETKNTREDVGFFELTPFAKFEIEGNKTHSSLQYLCANNIKDDPRFNNIYSNAK